MADDKKDFTGEEADSEVHGGKLFGDLHPQQPMFGSSNLYPEDAVDPQNLTSATFQQSGPGPEFTSQGISEEDQDVSLGFEPGSSFTRLAEAASTHLESVLASQNPFQPRSHFPVQQQFGSNFIPPLGNFPQQAPFEFENYANQILGPNMVPKFAATGISDNEQKANIGGAFVTDQDTQKPKNPPEKNEEVTETQETAELFPEDVEVMKHLRAELADKNVQSRNEIEAEVLTQTDEELLGALQGELSEATTAAPERIIPEDCGVGEHVSELEEVVVPKNEQHIATTAIIAGLEDIDGTTFDVIGGLSITTDDSERDNQKLEKLTSQEFPETIEEPQKVAAELEVTETIYPDEPAPVEMKPESEFPTPEGTAEAVQILEKETFPTEETFHLETDDLSTNHVAEQFEELNVPENEEALTIASNEDKIEKGQIPESPKPEIGIQEGQESLKETALEVESVRPPETTTPGSDFETSEIQESLKGTELESTPLQRSDNEELEPFPVEPEKAEAFEIHDGQPGESELFGEKFQKQTLYQELLQAQANQAETTEDLGAPTKIDGFPTSELKSVSEGTEELVSGNDISVNETEESLKQRVEPLTVLDPLDQMREAEKVEGAKMDENVAAADVDAVIPKSPVPVETKAADAKKKNPEKSTRTKRPSQNDSISTIKGAVGATVPKTTGKVAKKAPATAVGQSSLKAKTAVAAEKKPIPKTVPSTTVVKKTTVLREKNAKELGPALQKNAKSSLTAKPPTRTPMATKPLTTAPGTIQKKTPESVKAAKLRPTTGLKPDIKSRSTSRPKNPSSPRETTQKTKDLEQGEKELEQKQKKIGTIDLAPLVWMETLVPVYEQVWKIYESTNQITGKISTMLEKTVKKELVIDELLESLKIHGREPDGGTEEIPKSPKAKVLQSTKVEVLESIVPSDREAPEVEPELLVPSDREAAVEVAVPESLVPSDREAAEVAVPESLVPSDTEAAEVAVPESLVPSDREAAVEVEVPESLVPSDRKVADVEFPKSLVPSDMEAAQEKHVPSTSDALEVTEERNEEISIEKQVADNTRQCKIEVSESIPLSSSDTAEISVKMEPKFHSKPRSPIEEKQAVGSDLEKNQNVPGEEPSTMMDESSGLGPSDSPEIQKATENKVEVEEAVKEAVEVVSSKESRGKAAEDVSHSEKNLGIEERKKEPETEKPHEEPKRDAGQEPTEEAAGMTTFQAIHAEQQQQGEVPDIEQKPQQLPEAGTEVTSGINQNRGGGRQRQKKGQWGGMYSDMPEEYGYSGTGRGGQRQYQQPAGGGYHNYPPPQQQHDFAGFPGYQQLGTAGGFQGYYQQQQQPGGYQNHSRQQQQQQQGGGDYNQNYPGQQGHRKRNKRNKKPRNWQQQ